MVTLQDCDLISEIETWLACKATISEARLINVWSLVKEDFIQTGFIIDE